MREETELSSLTLLAGQRSHILLILSDAHEGRDAEFRDWYRGAYRQALSTAVGVLAGHHYEKHTIDITRGAFPGLPFRYLGIYDLSLDGASAAERLIEQVRELHQAQGAARAPATWLYYPMCEKVGRSPSVRPSMLTLAFANGIPSKKDEFREWYATRHIRHALNIPALVSGQCFERTQFQSPGALAPTFSTIALYEQVDSPESIIQAFDSLSPETLSFPTLDVSRFSEWVYRPLRE